MLPPFSRSRFLRREIHEVFLKNPRRALRLAAAHARTKTPGVVTHTMAHRFVLHHLQSNDCQITPEVQRDAMELIGWLLATSNAPTHVLNNLRKVSLRRARGSLLAELIYEQIAAHDHAHMRRILAECRSDTRRIAA